MVFVSCDSLKIFLPITILAILVLIPVNVYGGETLIFLRKELVFSNIDKLSISNVSPGSQRQVCTSLTNARNNFCKFLY